MQQLRSRNENWIRAKRLTACLVTAGAVWAVVLPAVGRQPGIRQYIQQNQELGIDPSAKFYTELPALPAVLDRVEAVQRRHPTDFW